MRYTSMGQFKSLTDLKPKWRATSLLLILALFLFGCREKECNEKSVNSDQSKIIQSVLDHESIQRYLFINSRPRERLPVIVTGPALGDVSSYCATKGGRMVVFKSAPDAGVKSDKAYFVFTRLEILSDRAEVQFQYPIEGLEVAMRLEKKEAAWVVVNKNLEFN